MYQFISTLFVATVAFSAFSAVSAPDSSDDDSKSESPTVVEQNKHIDKNITQKTEIRNR